MKVLDKLELVDRIGRELQSRMTYSEIDIYFSAYGIDCKDIQPSTNSKWVYVKEVLSGVIDEVVLKIADELELDHNDTIVTPKEATFWRTGHFKLFLSHLASFKVNAARLQQVLKKYAITSFVAHEDIEPSREWQTEIEAALETMDAMAVLLMPGFKESNWCDQEAGVAVGRNVLIIPVRKGLDPYGFIGKYQGIQAVNKNIGKVAEEIFKTLVSSTKTRSKIIRAISNAISQSTQVEDALEKLALLKSITNLPKNSLENLKSDIEENMMLMETESFIKEINIILSKYAVNKIKFGSLESKEWEDDMPF